MAQVYGQVGDVPPDLDEPERLVAFFTAIQELIHEGLLLAYHDRSDGGLFVTLAEMAFGGPCGLSITLDHCGPNPLASLFAEEVGAVLQVDSKVEPRVMEVLARHGLIPHTINLGFTTQERFLEIRHGGHVLFRRSIPALKQVWSELTREMQARRDNPTCAAQEFNLMGDERDPGLSMHPTYNPDEVFHIGGRRPRVAILREQGVNGHVEMAAAFDAAGFEAVDVHMTDLLAGRCTLDNFHGLVACGGFSYGDVLGAGSGWALSILYNERLRDLFQAFFARPDTFSLGVCNGCQMLAQLKDLIPGAECWPRFTRNRSEQFEARYVLVEVLPSPSIFLRDMAGSRLGIAVAHGEGFADFRSTGSLETARTQGLIALRYVDHFGQPTEIYPLNPNGSPEGITALTSLDGRATIMMPHPERGFRAVQMSYRPPNWPWDAGPWLRMFQNARRFVG